MADIGGWIRALGLAVIWTCEGGASVTSHLKHSQNSRGREDSEQAATRECESKTHLTNLCFMEDQPPLTLLTNIKGLKPTGSE